jgi:hypothetical protein
MPDNLSDRRQERMQQNLKSFTSKQTVIIQQALFQSAAQLMFSVPNTLK